MSETQYETIKPRVTEALARDLGKGIVRLDPSEISRLGLKVGDVVELEGRRKTVGKLMPTYSAHRGRGRVQIDGVTRENAGTAVDQPIEVRPSGARDADLVVLAPMSQPLNESEMRILGRLIGGLPIVVGDRVRVSLVGQRAADFKVLRTIPSGPVVVGSSTRIEIGKLATVEPLPKERESFRPFSYEDIGGLKRELGRVREIVELPLKFPEFFSRLGVAPPKGGLLYGPPGCGKTLIARAVAHETEASFFTINGPEIIHKFYGESEAKLREVFEQAGRQAPSIIFLDEIDAIAPKRDRVVGDVEKRVVAQLLTLMDGLAQRSQVVVLAATNLPNALDPALRRPGRFDREIALTIPDREARREILEIHRRGMPIDSEVDLDVIAANTHGFVGADIAALCREAAMACLTRNLPYVDLDRGSIPVSVLNKLEVTMDDFQSALREVEPSAIREVFVERPTVTWNDLGGLEGHRERLLEAIQWPLRHKQLLAKAGITPPRGILLWGPPGCGKTLLAKAVANETKVNFLSVKGPELLSKYVGDSERSIREIFQKARHSAPCLLFLDEIDAFLPTRGLAGATSGDRASDRVIGQFLAEMDGVETLSGVLVLGATNRPDLLDPALLRPGRFDLHLEIPLPDREARKAIAKIALRNKELGEDVSFDDIADATAGFSGAEVHAVCMSAALNAFREFLRDARANTKYRIVIERRLIIDALNEARPRNPVESSKGRLGRIASDG